MDNNYGFDESDLAAMNRYQLEACLNECHSVGRALNSGVYDVGSSDFRYLDNQFKLVLAEISKRKFNPVFWTKNSFGKMARVFRRRYLKVKGYVIHDLLLKQRSMSDWREFEVEVGQWTFEKLSGYSNGLDHALNGELRNMDGTEFSEKELFEFYIEQLIVEQESYRRPKKFAEEQEGYPYETKVDENGVRHEL